MERQFENRNLKLENCDIPLKNPFSRKPNLPPTTPSVPTPRVKPVIYRPFGTGTLNRRCSEAWWRAETVIYRHFGTGTPPTRGSVPSSRAKASPNRPQTALTPAFLPVFATVTLPTSTPEASWRGEGGFWPVFVTATLPTDASVASSRSHCELVFRIVALLGFMKFTWHANLHYRYL